MKYYIIAGEASGDLHGSHLIRALRERDPDADIRCWGGDRMAAAGGHVVRHIRDLAFMGFIEVVRHLPAILGNISFCKRDILDYRPDVVILIDYPGFNFRLFKFIKQHGFRLFYYISPQLWAWRAGRVRQVREYVDRMFVIFPFEKEFYARHGVEVDFVGHPLLDELGASATSDIETQNLASSPGKTQDLMSSFGKTQNIASLQREMPGREGSVIALLPGSRRQEISRLLPEYIRVIPHFPDHTFVIAGISGLGEDFYAQLIGGARCRIEWDNTYGLLGRADAAIVTSGTATLETALHGVPEVVCYRAGTISYLIARSLIRGIKYICIVNLIADRNVVTELIQGDVNETSLTRELSALLDGEKRREVLKGYEDVRQRLGSAGASEKTAYLMLRYLQKGS